MTLNYEKDNKERMPYEYYLEQFAKVDPIENANRLEIAFDLDTKRFMLAFLGSNYYVSWPDLAVVQASEDELYNPFKDNIFAKVLVLRYLLYSTTFLPNGEFRSYRELPSGELYFRQFQGRCIFRLIRKYGTRLEVFRKVMEALNAAPAHAGDCAYEIELFENLSIRFIIWEGDDEFPASGQILFSSNFPAAFGTYDLAEIGDICLNTFSAIEKLI